MNQRTAMSDELGTPIICSNCKCEEKIRLTKGTSIKSLWCSNCHTDGNMKRNTNYDKERQNLREAGKQ